jgi:DNA-binding XRE family transcriptional regulator
MSEQSAHDARKGDAKHSRRYTRAEVAKRLGVDPSTVYRWEQKGLLRPFTDAHGVTRYEETDIQRVIASKVPRGGRVPGEVAALAFSMFEDGASVVAIVIACARSPRDVRQLHAEWLALREADVKAPLPKAARIGKEEE